MLLRKQWDKNKLPSGRYSHHKPERIVIHHTYMPDLKSYKGISSIEGIRRYHVETKRWSDIGYHALISPDGLIYQGRPAEVVGAHCGGSIPKGARRNFGNTGSLGVSLIGNFDKEQPTEEQLKALRELLEYWSEKYEIDLKNVYGHCENATIPPKSCPGRNLFIELFGKNRWNKIFPAKK